MKNLDRVFLIAGVVSFSCLVGVSSCDSSKENKDRPSGAVVNSRLKENQWKVSYYFDEHEETHLFYGYALKFADDGSVTATNLNSRVGGRWSISGKVGDHVTLDFEFTLTDPFDELNSEWVIAESTDEQVVLEKENGSASPDKLTFSRI